MKTITVTITEAEARMIRMAIECGIDRAIARGRNSRVHELDLLQNKFYPEGYVFPTCHDIVGK